MNIKIGILNVPKHCNKHDLIHFVTVCISDYEQQLGWGDLFVNLEPLGILIR